MKSFLFVLFILSSSLNPILGQPNLLEKAKNNPSEALKLCKKFKEEYKEKNKSASLFDLAFKDFNWEIFLLVIQINKNLSILENFNISVNNIINEN